MKTNTMLETAIEVAWQVGDSLTDHPRAESRWRVADIALDIINKGLITEHSEDIDEIIGAYLTERGIKNEY
jgi:hypothetical protein